jgi:hypothetical protein
MADRAKYLFIRPPEQMQELFTAEGAENAEKLYGFKEKTGVPFPRRIF